MIEVEVSENKPEKNKGTDTQGDGRWSKRRKIGSIDEIEPVQTVEHTDKKVSDCWDTEQVEKGWKSNAGWNA